MLTYGSRRYHTDLDTIDCRRAKDVRIWFSDVIMLFDYAQQVADAFNSKIINYKAKLDRAPFVGP